MRRRNLQHFVRNELASAVVNRTADQHGIGLGFKPCPFAGQPLHVMKSVNYRSLSKCRITRPRLCVTRTRRTCRRRTHDHFNRQSSYANALLADILSEFRGGQRAGSCGERCEGFLGFSETCRLRQQLRQLNADAFRSRCDSLTADQHW